MILQYVSSDVVKRGVGREYCGGGRDRDLHSDRGVHGDVDSDMRWVVEQTSIIAYMVDVMNLLTH